MKDVIREELSNILKEFLNSVPDNNNWEEENKLAQLLINILDA